MSEDLTHCPGGACPRRNQCYRYRAETFGRFDAFGDAPWNADRQNCEQFWDIARLGPTEEDIRFRAYLRWQAAGSPADTADADWQIARAELEASVRERLREPDAE